MKIVIECFDDLDVEQISDEVRVVADMIYEGEEECMDCVRYKIFR